MTEHTPEAQAAYPPSITYLHNGTWDSNAELRTAFDRGRSSMVETVTSEAEGKELPEGSALVDANGDIFETAEHGGIYMTNEAGFYSWNWVKLPAHVVFRPDREEN